MLSSGVIMWHTPFLFFLKTSLTPFFPASDTIEMTSSDISIAFNSLIKRGQSPLFSLAIMHCKVRVPKILNKYIYSEEYCAVWPIYLFSFLTIGFAYSAGKYVDRSWEYINRSQTHECGIWDCGRAIPFLGTHKWDFSCSVCLPNLWVILAGYEGSEADNPARCATFHQQDLCQVTMWKALTF